MLFKHQFGCKGLIPAGLVDENVFDAFGVTPFS